MNLKHSDAARICDIESSNKSNNIVSYFAAVFNLPSQDKKEY